MAAQALRAGLSVEDIHAASKFDPWFMRELAGIVAAERGRRRRLACPPMPARCGG